MPCEVVMKTGCASGLALGMVLGLVLAGPLLAQPSGAAPARPGEAPPPAAPPRDVLAPVPSLLDEKTQPIDLPSALRLAGVQNPEILLAQERVVEAVAARQFAAAQFLPNLNAGFNFDVHNGVLQQATGNILRVNRDSLYVGLGANAVAAGTVNIPGIVWAGSTSDTIFNALISRQIVRQREFASQARRNEMLLRVAAAYLELLRAEGSRAYLGRSAVCPGIGTEDGAIHPDRAAEVSRGRSSPATDEGPNGPPQGG